MNVLDVEIFFKNDVTNEEIQKAVAAVTGEPSSNIIIRSSLDDASWNGTEVAQNKSENLQLADVPGFFNFKIMNFDFPFEGNEDNFAQMASRTGIHVFIQGKNENPWDDTFWLVDYFNGEKVGEVYFEEDDNQNAFIAEYRAIREKQLTEKS